MLAIRKGRIREGLSSVYNPTSVNSWEEFEQQFTDGLEIPNRPEIKEPLEHAFVIHQCLGKDLKLESESNNHFFGNIRSRTNGYSRYKRRT